MDVNGKKWNTNGTFIVPFTCELNGILLLWQFKPTISNQHIKMTKSTSRWRQRTNAHTASGKFCRPNYRYILHSRAHWMCTKLANRKWPKVRPANFCSHSSSLHHSRRSHQLKSFSPATCECDGETVVWCELCAVCVCFFTLVCCVRECMCVGAYVPYVRWAAADCRLIHGIYFIRRLCTLLASIRCTFLCWVLGQPVAAATMRT